MCLGGLRNYYGGLTTTFRSNRSRTRTVFNVPCSFRKHAGCTKTACFLPFFNTLSPVQYYICVLSFYFFVCRYRCLESPMWRAIWMLSKQYKILRIRYPSRSRLTLIGSPRITMSSLFNFLQNFRIYKFLTFWKWLFSAFDIPYLSL